MNEIDKNAVRFQLNVPKSNLLTFAIYSRDFNKDIMNQANSKASVII